MVKFSDKRVFEIFSNFSNKKIAVIGDLMLDCYIYGNVNRISPEAPVPVIEFKEEFYRFGGAANVGLNIKSLGAIPLLMGVMGEDREGKIFKELLNESEFYDYGIIFSKDRPSTVKTRVIAHTQHVVRIDKEIRIDINEEIEQKILSNLEIHKNDIDGIILQDYNKGVLTTSLIRNIIKIAEKNNIIITVDPKFRNFFEYKGVTVFKPNKKESEDALGYKFETEEKLLEGGMEIKNRLGAKYVLITRSEKGMTLFGEGDKPVTIPTKARKVADVSGAGDTVIATITLALASGASISEAATIANLAGGLVCEEPGIVPIDKNNLMNNLLY